MVSADETGRLAVAGTSGGGGERGGGAAKRAKMDSGNSADKLTSRIGVNKMGELEAGFILSHPCSHDRVVVVLVL